MNTPKECQPYESSFKKNAWEQYTFEELCWWVKLYTKRAKHRVPGEKQKRDLIDAKNYLAFVKAYCDNIETSTYNILKSELIDAINKLGLNVDEIFNAN